MKAMSERPMQMSGGKPWKQRNGRSKALGWENVPFMLEGKQGGQCVWSRMNES